MFDLGLDAIYWTPVNARQQKDAAISELRVTLA
jgi:hypothetical protein